MPKKRARRWWILAGVACLLAAAGYAAYGRLSSRIEVDVFVARAGTVEENVSAVAAGTVKSPREAVISAEVMGKVAAVRAAEGDEVRKGAVLATFDDAELDRQVDASRADIASAENMLSQAQARREEASQRHRAEAARAANNLAKARDDRERAERLFKGGFLSKAEMEQADTLLANAREEERIAASGEAAVRAIDREIDSLRAKIAAAGQQAASLAERRRKLAIVAPFGGVVTKKSVEVGEVKSPGAPLFVLADPGGLYVEGQIDESETSKVRLGQPVRLFPDAYQGETFSGRVSEIKPTVEASKEVSRANTIEVEPLSPPRPLRLGMSVDIEVRTGGKDNVVFAPSAAVMEREGKKFVYVVDRGKVARRDVTTGIGNWERTEILSGLKVGEEVVTSLEIKTLSPGSRVGIRARK